MWGIVPDANCTAAGADSLEAVIQASNTPESLPVITLANVERIYHVASATGHLARFVVFGSFATDKPAPNDMDVFLIMDDAFDGNTLHGEAALLFDHAATDVHFGVSAFWVRRLAAFGGEQTTIEYWQATRGGGRRVIIEIVEDTNDHERPGTWRDAGANSALPSSDSAPAQGRYQPDELPTFGVWVHRGG